METSGGIVGETLFRQLYPVRQRQRWKQILRGLDCGTMIGAGSALVIAVLFRLEWLTSARLGWVALFGAPALSAVLVAWRTQRRSDWLETARTVDRHYKLKDRTETALALLRRQATQPLIDIEQLQIADTLRHLDQLKPEQVIPDVRPRSWRVTAVVVCATLIVLGWVSRSARLAAEPPPPLPAIVEQAEIVAAELHELLEQLPEDHAPEVEELIQELLAKTEEMKAPGVDVREALAKLSEMQAALQAAAAELHVAATDAQLQQIGEALQSAESLRDIGQALQSGDYDKAAGELSKLDEPKLDRHESRAVADKLQKASENAADQGLKKLSEAAKQTAEGLEKNDSAKAKSGLSKIGESARKQSQAKQISSLLKKQSDKLAESKGNAQANAQGNSKQGRPNQKAGQGSSAEIQGHRTELAVLRNEEQIQGQKNEDGESETESMSTTEAKGQVKRELREVYQQYRKLSEAVLETEDIPLGHRQAIRRYFEAIRPRAVDDAAVETPAARQP
jgi:hypothetical protein